MIFIGDMGDVLSKDVPFDYLDSEVVAHVTSPKGSKHVWLLLTKQAQRLAEYAEHLAAHGQSWPENLWAGTSVTGPKTVSRVHHLGRVPAKVRFVSYEPALEAVNWGKLLPPVRANWQCQKCTAYLNEYETCPWCHAPKEWLCGSHHANRPDPENGFTGWKNTQPFHLSWARYCIAVCESAGVPCFVKQVGSNAVFPDRSFFTADCDHGPLEDPTMSPMIRVTHKDSHGGDWNEWKPDLRVRQVPGVVTSPASA
jgi:hypothetical protein